MGKVRRLRQKYHASLASERAEKVQPGQNATTSVPQLVPHVQGGTTCVQRERDNIFAGLQIKLRAAETVSTTEPVEFDKSIVSVGQQTWMETKTEKRKKRHKELLKKIDLVRAGKQAEKERKKREKTVVTGDMHPMLNALPSLRELMTSQSKEKSQKSRKSKGTPKQKIAKREIFSDIQMFTSVHQDPQFTTDPFKAVAVALENRVLCED